MRYILLCIPTLVVTVCLGQIQHITGTYSNGISFPTLKITLNTDSTFVYTSSKHPIFFEWEEFSEKGKWTVSGDTIILNPQLVNKPFIETYFREGRMENDSLLYLTVNHIKRYFDNDGQLVKVDTIQVKRYDYAFNRLKKKKLNRVAARKTLRCAFAGYIPPETITSSRTITILKPSPKMESIYIGCYEMQGIKEFKINNPISNYLTLEVYSNYYLDGQIRQKKMLFRNEDALYIKQKSNGKFDKGNWTEGTVLKKEKSGS